MSQQRGVDARAEILAFIRTEYGLHGYSPTIRQIAEHIHRAPSNVHRHVRLLVAQGLIESERGLSRTIRPVQPLSGAGRKDSSRSSGT